MLDQVAQKRFWLLSSPCRFCSQHLVLLVSQGDSHLAGHEDYLLASRYDKLLFSSIALIMTTRNPLEWVVLISSFSRVPFPLKHAKRHLERLASDLNANREAIF